MSFQDLSFGGTFSGLSSPLDWSLAPAPAVPGYHSNQNAACASRFAGSTAGSMQDKGCPPPVVVSLPFTGNASSAAPAAAAAMGVGNSGLLYGARRHQQQHLEPSAQANLTYQAQQQQLLLCQQQQAVAAANAQQQLLLARLQQQHQQAACMSGSSRLGGHMQQLGGQPSPGTQLQQQQQAAMAARAAAAAAAAAPAPAGGVLYGNYRSNASLQPGGVNASASSRLYPYQHPMQHQHQHQQRLSGAGSLQPAAAGGRVSYHHHHQQQQQQQHSGAGSSQRSSHLAWHAAGTSSSSGGGAVAGGGRWSGPVALMELPSAGPSQQSDGSSGSDPALECDEELQSVEVAGSQQQLLLLQQQHYQQQQQQRVGSRPGSRPVSGSRLWQLPQAAVSDHMFLDESGSTKADSEGGNDDDLFNLDAMDQDHHHHQQQQQQQQQQQVAGTPPAASARGVTATQASAARQSVVLQVLGRTAATRKGGRVLTAAPAAAEHAGAASVRPRLLVTEVSVYLDGAASSRLALEQANRLMSRMALPDNVAYMPISADSFLFKAASAWQFPAFVIALGSSYLQRMMERLPQLADAALACPGFEDYCAFLTAKPDVLPPRFSEADAVPTLSMLRSVQFTCVFLATKVADQVHALGLLRFMLSHMSVNQQVVSMETAADVEARCLETLGWRLGPFFLDDQLGGNDEELWAAAMGHWEYGSDADLAAC